MVGCWRFQSFWFYLEETHAHPGSRGGLQRELRLVRRDLCLPLLEAQDGRKMLVGNNLAPRVIYSMEIQLVDLMDVDVVLPYGQRCVVCSESLFTCGVVARLLLLTQQPYEALSSHASNCRIVQKIFNMLAHHADTLRL